MGDKKVYIYDIETHIDVFTYYAINRDTDEEVFYIISPIGDMNDLPQLIEHLYSINGHIGFNNLNFDYPVLHNILLNQSWLSTASPREIVDFIYTKAQETIKTEFSAIRESEVIIPQLDLFKIWHFDNKARMTSLKKLEIAMQADNVQDMPYKHNERIDDFSQVVEMLQYNRNDVVYTKMFYELTIPKLELRRGLRKKYGIECLNYSDSKIGEELMLKLYCESTGKSVDKIKKLRTKRKEFKFEECIPKYVSFNTWEFNGLLKYLKDIVVYELKDSFSYTFEYNGFEVVLGTGGIHGCIKPGVYESSDSHVIIDSDVASLYPSLAIVNDLYPEHLGEEFIEIYKNGIVEPRLEAKRSGDKVMADGLKLSANAIYGKSSSEFSFLYDPLYTLRTTLAGQLSLSMLLEMIMTRIPGITMLQVNTDGLTSIVPKEYVDNYYEIAKEWEGVTGLTLEHVDYKKMIIRDVNNYIGIYTNDKVKYKGAFKPNSEMRKDGEYHKSFSQGIVATAVAKYFIEGIPVEKTIKECTDIYEFCKTGNTTGDWWAETFDIDDNGEEINIVRQQKNNRYYLSDGGVRFRKCTYKEKDGETILTKTEYEADLRVEIFNKYIHHENFTDYKVNYQYYVDEAYKIIHKIDGTEERLEKERREERERQKLQREEENFLTYCWNKPPTKRQLDLYGKEWLIEKYGLPKTKEQLKEEELL